MRVSELRYEAFGLHATLVNPVATLLLCRPLGRKHWHYGKLIKTLPRVVGVHEIGDLAT